ncbi:hypothetical protein [Kitasatospora sp. NPDC097643]|uniref:hypothetical protein n=1 Tax=Kitasatospora sp. NPDC097643 TaxID=3157230 RepID=UPI00331C6FAB
MELTTEPAAIGVTGRLGIVRPGVPSATVVTAYGQPSAEERRGVGPGRALMVRRG